MPTNTLDHRTLSQENMSDLITAEMSGLISSNLDQAAPALVATNFVGGAAAGTTPPAVVVTPGSNALRGNITFGTGSATPAGGILYTVTFPFALVGMVHSGTAVPFAFIFLTPATQASGAFNFSALPTYSGATVTGFTINTTSTVTASQANTVYSLNYLVMG